MSKSALAITDEHQDLADAAMGQLTRLATRASARATLEGGSPNPADVWKAAAELGWLGLAIAEEHGGSGFGLAELAIVLEAQGRELSPGPFLPATPVHFAAVATSAGGGSIGRDRPVRT